ncbi:purine-binding chemotaxis protein CheW [Gammaproteobacteria bacterium]
MTASSREMLPTKAITTGTTEQRQYLTFLLGAEMFGIGILMIKEIIGYGNITLVPMVPPFIRGVINLRGVVVPVFDLAIRFGRTAQKTTKHTCIVIIDIVVGDHTNRIGIIVDAVSEVIEIADADIRPAPEFGANLRTDFMRGMGKINDKFVILLDMDRVLTLDEVSVAAIKQ